MSKPRDTAPESVGEDVIDVVRDIAHGLNNELAVILNYAKFAQEGVELEQMRADVRQIRSAAEHARDLASRLALVIRREDPPRSAGTSSQ
jgi:hypothetical protein